MWIIPPEVYRQLMEQSAPAANFTNELMAGHFSDVMWLLDQVLNKNWTHAWRRFAGGRRPGEQRLFCP